MNEEINEEIKREVEEINKSVQLVALKLGGNWTAILRGVLAGFGSVIGAFMALAIIGWILNIVGIIPAFHQQADLWRESLQQAAVKQLPNK